MTDDQAKYLDDEEVKTLQQKLNDILASTNYPTNTYTTTGSGWQPINQPVWINPQQQWIQPNINPFPQTPWTNGTIGGGSWPPVTRAEFDELKSLLTKIKTVLETLGIQLETPNA